MPGLFYLFLFFDYLQLLNTCNPYTHDTGIVKENHSKASIFCTYITSISMHKEYFQYNIM